MSSVTKVCLKISHSSMQETLQLCKEPSMVWVFDHILSIGVGSWKFVPQKKKPGLLNIEKMWAVSVCADVFLGLVWLNRYLIKRTCGTCYGKALHLQVKQGFSCKCSWKTTCWCFQMVSNVFMFDFNAFWRRGWWFAMAFMFSWGWFKTCQNKHPLKGVGVHIPKWLVYPKAYHGLVS